MQPERFVDHLGNSVRHDDQTPLDWRISIYVIAIRNGSILMVEPAWASRLELPGGEIELARQETLLEGAIRECREETGYRLTPNATGPQFVAESFFHYRSANRYCHSLMFAVAGTVDEPPDPDWIRPSEDIRSVRWEPLSSLDEELVYAPHWAMLQTCGLL